MAVKNSLALTFNELPGGEFPEAFLDNSFVHASCRSDFSPRHYDSARVLVMGVIDQEKIYRRRFLLLELTNLFGEHLVRDGRPVGAGNQNSEMCLM
jgi:hypothetical protein